MEFKEIRNETINDRNIIEYELWDGGELKYEVTYDQWKNLPPHIVASPRKKEYLPAMMSKDNLLDVRDLESYKAEMEIHFEGWGYLTTEQFDIALKDYQFAQKVAEKLTEMFLKK